MTAPSMKQLAESKEDNGVSKQTIFTVDPTRVVLEEGWNGRTSGPDLEAHIERLRLAMLAGASMPPIKVITGDDGSIIVRDGHCRTMAAQRIIEAGGSYKLSAEHFRGNDLDAVLLMVGSGTGALQLTPLEAGRQYLRAVNMGATVAQIAERLGVHRSTIENGLKLAEMPAAVQSMVGTGAVAAHTALKAVKAHGKDAAKVLKDASADGKKVTPKKIAPGPGKPERGQTLPPGNTQASFTADDIRKMAEAAGFRVVDIVTQANQPHSTAAILDAVRSAESLPPLNPPPVNDGMRDLVARLADINIVVTKLDRDTVVALVKEARALLGRG